MGENHFANWRTLFATLFSVALIVGAYALARGIEYPSSAHASTESELLQAIATKDSNGDGLPDWQKVLYGIPINSTTTDYFNLGMTDGEAVARGLIVPKAIADIPSAASSTSPTIIDPSLPPVPPEGTLTEAFARSFFTLYFNTKAANNNTELTPAEVDDLANQTLASIFSLVSPAPDYKLAHDLTVAGSGEEALREFAVNAEAVLVKNRKAADATKSEILYLQDIVDRNDRSALPHLVALAKMYRDSAVGLAALPVPAELVGPDLALINAMMRGSGITSDFARVDTDPLAAMLALDQYSTLDQSLTKALATMSDVYTNAKITFPAGAPGAFFLDTLARYRAAAQAL